VAGFGSEESQEEYMTCILGLPLQQTTELKFEFAQTMSSNQYFLNLFAFLSKFPMITTLTMVLYYKPDDKAIRDTTLQFHQVTDLKIHTRKQLASAACFTPFPNLTRISLYGEWSKKVEIEFDFHLK
jgi:hypothetical protein